MLHKVIQAGLGICGFGICVFDYSQTFIHLARKTRVFWKKTVVPCYQRFCYSCEILTKQQNLNLIIQNNLKMFKEAAITELSQKYR